jgi:Putative DNA-binding domain
MLFDGKPLAEISDTEVNDLVGQHVSERQHLEFKVTVDLRSDEEKLEVLRDIASLANGGGGYLIVGIRDDGRGRAQKFEPTLVGDTQKIRKSIRDLCLDHIHDRILGLEFDCRVIDSNPVILIRIPQSDRVPHMVTFNRHTDFVTRYDDGKREMKFAEIRETFTGDSLARRLDAIEAGVHALSGSSSESSDRERALQAAADGSVGELLSIDNGKVLSEAYRSRFVRYAGARPFFSISAIPMQTHQEFLDLNTERFRALLDKPPGSRWAGWDMNFKRLRMVSTPYGLEGGQDDFRLVEIWRNGYVQLRAFIDERFCWGQPEEEFRKQPVLNPVPVAEYIVSFLRFYHALLDVCSYNGAALLNIQYLHIKGTKLRSRTWFHDPSKSFPDENLVIPDYRLEPNFEPDVMGYKVASIVFESFGLDAHEIPAWNDEDKRFEFEKLK